MKCAKCGGTMDYRATWVGGACAGCGAVPYPASKNGSTRALLEALVELPWNDALHQALVVAHSEGFHDFESVFDMPQTELYTTLERFRLDALELNRPADAAAYQLLRDRVERGDFDATDEEANAWAETPEGKESIAFMETREGKRLIEGIKQVAKKHSKGRGKKRRPRGKA
jgi:hypothetical protein